MSNPGEEDYPMEEKYPLNEEEPHENAEKKEETVVVVTQDGTDTSVPCGYIVAIVLSILSFFCVPFLGVHRHHLLQSGDRGEAGPEPLGPREVRVAVQVHLRARHRRLHHRPHHRARLPRRPAFFKIIFDSMLSYMAVFQDSLQQTGTGDEASVNGGNNGTLTL